MDMIGAIAPGREFLMLDLAAFVQGRRRELGLTQLDVADMAGVSERFVRDVEAGKRSVRLDKTEALLEALGLRLSAVLQR